MPAYVVVTKLTTAGAKALANDSGRIDAVRDEVEQLGARIISQYRVVGPYDFVTFVEAPDNETASYIATVISSIGTVKLQVYPAIAFSRFKRLLIDEEPYRSEPHRWQTQLWARAARRASRYWVMTRHMRRLCQPMVVEGRENLKGVRGPVLFIANHTSHIDTPTLVSALPAALREHSAVAAAADRFYRVSQRSWWFSLFWNTYPIARGGGMKALDYSKWLLQHGWSIVIFPEGGRFKAGAGPALSPRPDDPRYAGESSRCAGLSRGLHLLMPKGTRTAKPGPALVRFGAPVSLDDITDVPEGTDRLRAAVLGLAHRDQVGSADAAG